MKLIEAWGSGIRKMRTELEEYPEIELMLREAGHAFQVQFIKKGLSGGSEQPELQPESLNDRVIKALAAGPLSKAEISRLLGQKEVSGQLNTVIRKLRKEGSIEYTIPEKPNSRLQKYRLCNINRQLGDERN